jgi:hypothetical protein
MSQKTRDWKLTSLNHAVQRDVVERLARRPGSKHVSKHIAVCDMGLCEACGDACAKRTNKWLDANYPKVNELYARQRLVTTCDVRITRERWQRKPEQLFGVGLSGLKKAVRRALDSINQPTTIAVGYVDAWYGWRQWEVGFRLIIAGPTISEIYGSAPLGDMTVEEVSDVDAALASLMTTSHVAKRLPPLDRAEGKPGTKRRGEYYAWLSSIQRGSRFIRYGCDRHFNPLKKSKRLIHLEQKKGHPYPKWLEPHMFGNHPWNCQCIPCQGLGNEAGISKQKASSRQSFHPGYYDLGEEIGQRSRGRNGGRKR